MNDIENDVFTLVATALRAEYGANNIFITGEYTPTPPKFPCVYLHEADNFNNGYDGCNHEIVTGTMYEVEIYSNKQNGKKAEAKKIMKSVDDILTPLGFRRNLIQQIPNMSDATIFRLLARYSANVIDNEIYRR